MVDFKKVHDRRKVLAAFQAGDYKFAAAMATSLLKEKKNDYEMLHVFGMSCVHIGRHAEAIEPLQKVLRQRPDDDAILSDLGYAYLWSGRFEEAHVTFDRALELRPRSANALTGKASTFDREGDYDGVARTLAPIVAAGVETPPMAVICVRMLQHLGKHDEATSMAERHLANATTDLTSRSFLCELAAKSYEKLGEYGKAFAAFENSNKLHAQPFDVDEYVSKIDDLIATYSASNLARVPRPKLRSDLPVFIASMPRSGSTLVEQIIHAHPKAHGAGEITDFHRMAVTLPDLLESMQPYPACLGDLTSAKGDNLVRMYLNELQQHDPRAKRIVNKHLLNYFHVGLIELLLPNARVVHVKRDPLDNCFSIFMAQISTSAQPWASDLRNIGIAYKQYERIMAHWHDVLKIPILDVQYEDLVEDTETWIRRIIEFCGLPWDDKCLRYWEADRSVMTLSYDQVRKPIYKSAVKRYEKYDAYLGPLKDVLASEKVE